MTALPDGAPLHIPKDLSCLIDETNYPIAGVIATSSNLTNTDGALGVSGLVYSPGDEMDVRGLDGFGAGAVHDWVRVSSDLRTLEFSIRYHPKRDQIRIITATPELASVALFGTPAPVLGLAVGRRRRRAGQAGLHLLQSVICCT